MFSWLTHGRRGRTLGVLALAAAFLLCVASAPASAQADKRVVRVMTYNMDAGTDFLFFFTNPDMEAAYAATVAELQASGFEERAAALADVIAAEKPYLVSLQEATIWDYVDSSGRTVFPLADQLELLRAALRQRGLHYKVVASQPLTNLALDLQNGLFFHFLDRNAILARTDLSRAELALSKPRGARFATTSEPLPGFVQVNGWMSVDAKIRGKSMRFFATHLQSATYEGDPVQPAQGNELTIEMNRSPFPVALAGDLNSDMSGLGLNPLDSTPTAPAIVAAGYTDAWTVRHAPYEGLTWPLFWEDIYAGVYPDGNPIERIDLIFAKGLRVLDAKVVGTVMPVPSDHAGVVATLLIRK